MLASGLEGLEEIAFKAEGTAHTIQVLAGGSDSPGGLGLTVTLKVMAFCRPSGEIWSSSATAWISRALTTEAVSCASVLYAKYQQQHALNYIT